MKSKFRKIDIPAAICFLALLVIATLYIARPLIASMYLGKTLMPVEITSSYDGQQQEPLDIGSVGNSKGPTLLRLSFNFQLSEQEGFPNLFQTDTANAGIRLESHNGTLGLVIGDTSVRPPTGTVLPNIYTRDRSHSVELSAIRGSYIDLRIDGEKIDVKGAHTNFSLRDVRLGMGFDETRRFSGKISAIKLSYANGDWLAKLLFIDGYYLVGIAAALIAQLCQRFSAYNRPKPRQSAFARLKRRQLLSLIERLHQPLLFFCLFLLASGVVYAYAVIHFLAASQVLDLTLLAGFKTLPGANPFKSEFLLFVLLELSLMFALGSSWLVDAFRKLYPFRLSLGIFTLVICVAAPLLAYCIDDKIARVVFLSAFLGALGYVFVGIAVSHLFPTRVLAFFIMLVESTLLFVLRWLAGRLDRLGQIRSLRLTSRAVLPLAVLVLATTAVFPLISSWYPVVLPNDYFELRDTATVSQAAGAVRMGRDDLAACLMRDKSAANASPQNCANIDASLENSGALLRDAIASTALWQGEPGRLLFHHSYLFVPARHLLTYGFDEHVPYLYGYGNTAFHALLMVAAGGPTLSSYFETFPIAEALGIATIAAILLFITRSWWAMTAGLLLSVSAFYLISFEAIFLAASFSPLRFVGFIVQILSIGIFCTNSSRARYVVLPLGAIASLFWNREFGQIGILGQALVIFAPHLALSFRARLIQAGTIVLILAIGSLYPSTGQEIVNTVNLSFFNISMAWISGHDAMIFLAYMAAIQTVLFSMCLFFPGPQRAFRVVLVPMLAMMMTKYLYNAAPQHFYFVCVLLWPLLLIYLPWRPVRPINPNRAYLDQPFPLLIVGSALSFAIVTGLAYDTGAAGFRARYITPFERQPWSALGESVPFVAAEAPIAGRVDAIRQQIRPDDRLLLLSPFDHALSFYVNPRRYCGHFDLLTNFATLDVMKTVTSCTAHSRHLLVVYDHALESRCPTDSLQVQPNCRMRSQMKYNLTALKESLEPSMHLVGSNGDLDFYRSENADGMP